jgi:hypothetical protein
MSFHGDEYDNHIHEVGFGDNHEAVPVTNPDDFYDRLDRRLNGENEPPAEEDAVTFKEMASALAVVLDFICNTPHPNVIAGRALALQFLLPPTESRYESVSQIAEDVKLTKAALSKAVIQFADAMNVRLPVGKRKGTRQTFKEKQLALVAEHKHASDSRRRNRETAA